MKRLLLPLLAALALPTVVYSEPTWIKTYSTSTWCEVLGYGWMPKSECKRVLGDFYVELVGKYEMFVDAKSIVNRGPIRDFNVYHKHCEKEYGCFENKFSKTFNCSNETYYSNNDGWISWREEQGRMPIDKYYDYEKYRGMMPSIFATYNYVCLDFRD